jgi:hypothetical protein
MDLIKEDVIKSSITPTNERNQNTQINNSSANINNNSIIKNDINPLNNENIFNRSMLLGYSY